MLYCWCTSLLTGVPLPTFLLMTSFTPSPKNEFNAISKPEIQEKQPWYEKCWESRRVNNANQLDYVDNLNELIPRSGEGYGRLKEVAPTQYTDAQVKPVFRNIEEALVEEIHKHTLIVGCVAWLTSVPILQALQGKSVQFVLQQEDWLRPDSSEWSTKQQRILYNKLTGIDNFVAGVDRARMSTISPVYLCGKPKTSSRNQPRMHHKFLLFGNQYESSLPEFSNKINHTTFDLVWTGSYNITANATRSLENGIFIKSKEIIDAYYEEWRQVLLSSVRVQDKWWDLEYAWSNEDDEGIRDGT